MNDGFLKKLRAPRTGFREKALPLQLIKAHFRAGRSPRTAIRDLDEFAEFRREARRMFDTFFDFVAGVVDGRLPSAAPVARVGMPT